DAPARSRIFDGHLDDVADTGITALGATEHLDAHNSARTGVVGHVQRGLHLDHDFSCSNLTGITISRPGGYRDSCQFWSRQVRRTFRRHLQNTTTTLG